MRAATCLSFLDRFQPARCARNKRHSGALHRLPGAGFRSHRIHRGGRRANEFHTRVHASLGKARVFRKKSVAGMDRFRTRLPGDVKNFPDVEIRLRRRRGTDRISFVGFAHVQRRAIHVGVNRDRGNPHFMAGANHAHRNLATVSDQNFLEHTNRSSELKILQETAANSFSFKNKNLLRIEKAAKEGGAFADPICQNKSPTSAVQSLRLSRKLDCSA
jgi:hypothetical protein